MSDLKPEVFEAAADYLQENGHTKNAYCKDGRRCALGALYEFVGRIEVGLGPEAIWHYDDYSNMLAPVDEVIAAGYEYAYEFEATIGQTYFDIPEWNDEPNRKRSQVIAAFRKTATRVRNSQ